MVDFQFLEAKWKAVCFLFIYHGKMEGKKKRGQYPDAFSEKKFIFTTKSNLASQINLDWWCRYLFLRLEKESDTYFHECTPTVRAGWDKWQSSLGQWRGKKTLWTIWPLLKQPDEEALRSLVWEGVTLGAGGQKCRRSVWLGGLGNPAWGERHPTVVCSFHKQVICSSCLVAYSFGLLTGFLKLSKPCHSSSKLPLGIFDFFG